MTLQTPTEKRAGETIVFPYDWTSRLAAYGGGSVVQSFWDVESGDVVLTNPSFVSPLTAVTVSEGTPDTESILANTVRVSTGLTLINRFRLQVLVGDDGSENVVTYYGVGVAGKTDVTGLQTSSAFGQLGFDVPLTAVNQKLYIAHRKSWGRANFAVGGFGQTGAFGAPSTIWIGGEAYYLYESTDLVTVTDLTLQVLP